MMPANSASRRERNRRGQARFIAQHFGKHGDLARLRADVRLEVRAALGRLAAYRNLTMTMLIEELSLMADRRTAHRLTGEARERYRQGYRNFEVGS
jgi:hypothetical protein